MKETRYLIIWKAVDVKTHTLQTCWILDGEESWLFMKSKEEALATCKDMVERDFKELQDDQGTENVHIEQIKDGWKIIDDKDKIIDIYKIHSIEIEY